jgi:hypothetical protein
MRVTEAVKPRCCPILMWRSIAVVRVKSRSREIAVRKNSRRASYQHNQIRRLLGELKDDRGVY